MDWQNYLADYKYPAGPFAKNPYAYAHTWYDIDEIVKAVRKAKGKRMKIQLIVPGHYHWPLPWHLRDMAIEYCEEIPADVKEADMVIADYELQNEIINKIRAMRIPILTEEKLYLRPDVRMQIYMTLDAKESIER